MRDSAYIELDRIELAPLREQRLQDREDMADRDIYDADAQRRMIATVTQQQNMGILGSLFPKHDKDELRARLAEAEEAMKRAYKDGVWI